MVSLQLPWRLAFGFAVLVLLGVFRDVSEQADASEPPSGIALIAARTKKFPPEGVHLTKQWARSINIVSGENPHIITVHAQVCAFDRFWGEGEKFDEFRVDVLRSFVVRTEQLNQDVLNKFQVALKAACGEAPDILNCVAPLVALDHIFKDDRFNAAPFDATIKRLSLLPQESVAVWARATDTDKFDAALFLVRFDSLFADDTFRHAAFQRGIEKTSSASTAETK